MSRSKKETGAGLFDFKAVARYCDRNIYKRYQKAREQLEKLNAQNTVYAFHKGPDPHQCASSEYKDACEAACSNLKSKLRGGDLILAGYVSGPYGRDPKEPMIEVPNDVLATRNLGIDKRNKTIKGNGLIFWVPRVFTPSEFRKISTKKEASAPAPDKLAPPKGKRGRKIVWPWDDAAREMMRLANSPDGLPTTQADIEKHILKFFLKENRNAPTESAIRAFVVKHLPPNYR